MTSKKRVRTTFRHKEPDRIPIFEQGIASNVASEILGKDADTGGSILRRNEAEARLNGEGDAFVSKVLEDIIKVNAELDLDVARLPWLLYITPKKKLDGNTYYKDLEQNY
ncbi:unnamed protein product [marine sediment metagenome]|uniref:Uncharacterized protein n=1 Tax=marine sediment metagenome TaxID=412755 RepID=X1I9R9_9ZZZZ